MIRVHVDRGGGRELVEVRLERSDSSDAFTAHLNDRTFEVEIDGAAERGGRLRLHGKVIPFRAWRHDDTIDLWIAGRIYTVCIPRRVAQRAGEVGASTPTGELTAPMPGTVFKINVKEGETFRAHDPLIVMESMKMEMSLSSPQPGRVKEILCGVGDLVELGELLAKLEDE